MMRAHEKEAQFAAAIEQHRDALYRICCAYVRDEADRQDIYQELLIHIWKSLDAFRGQANLGTWLYRVGVNTCLGWLRREKRRSQMLERAGEERQVVEANSAAPPVPSREEYLQQLYIRIAELPPVDRLLVSLYLEEMNTTQMAEVLGISEGNVRVKLHRIKNQLRETWEKESYEPR
jgi:RNA polymerase sigma-70 factor, ECF subfamily